MIEVKSYYLLLWGGHAWDEMRFDHPQAAVAYAQEHFPAPKYAVYVISKKTSRTKFVVYHRHGTPGQTLADLRNATAKNSTMQV